MDFFLLMSVVVLSLPSRSIELAGVCPAKRVRVDACAESVLSRTWLGQIVSLPSKLRCPREEPTVLAMLQLKEGCAFGCGTGGSLLMLLVRSVAVENLLRCVQASAASTASIDGNG